MKLWGGRFSGRRDPLFEKFSESFSLDQRFVLYDLRVNLAYVKALAEARVLQPREAGRIGAGLEALRREVQGNPGWANGQSAEDVHTWVEATLERLVGDAARKLRTGRSRNDLVATEMRLYVKDATLSLERALVALLTALVSKAQVHAHVVLPGYTHLQPAQPILFAHYLLAYFEMFSRDGSRLRDCRVRADELPMGAGALAGTTFPINRERLAKELGFARVARNSVDVTSDRDPVAELLFACALCMLHLSRWAEDLIIYSSPGFGFVELADAYSTGSSLMPQKKNPDSLELIRGKCGRVFGSLNALFVTMKGLPMTYNRDMQEDKEPLFDAADQLDGSLEMARVVVESAKLNPAVPAAAAEESWAIATDLADALARAGTPFHRAHQLAGQLVLSSLRAGKKPADWTAEDLTAFAPEFTAEMARYFRPAEGLKTREITGGSGPAAVSKALDAAEARLESWRR